VNTVSIIHTYVQYSTTQFRSLDYIQ